MKLEAGHKMIDGSVIDCGKRIARFLADDGRVMFEVKQGKDGKTIEVRAVESCFVDGVMYSTSLILRPNVTNSVDVTVSEYGK